uniref:Liver stage antigen, related n=1 Tax=Trepomonas sp. PC1 TaxID=1076344 RepID=A0A146K8I8_9EUKA|eukprot:JAP91851.1 Liver stage antigen, related [Trepomonas sp. PC1]
MNEAFFKLLEKNSVERNEFHEKFNYFLEHNAEVQNGEIFIEPYSILQLIEFVNSIYTYHSESIKAKDLAMLKMQNQLSSQIACTCEEQQKVKLLQNQFDEMIRVKHDIKQDFLKQVTQAKVENLQLKDKLEMTENQLIHSQGRHESTMQKLHELTEDHCLCTQKMEDLKQEIQRLQESEIQKKFSILSEGCKQHQIELQKLQEKLQSEETLVLELKKDKQQLRSDAEQLKQQQSLLQKQKQDAESDLAKIKLENKNLAQELLNCQTKWKKADSAQELLEQTVQKLNFQSQQQNSAISKQKQQIEVLELQNENLSQQAQIYQQQDAQKYQLINDQLLQIQSTNFQLTQVQVAFAKQQAENEHLKQQIRDLAGENDVLTKNQAKVDFKIEEYEEKLQIAFDQTQKLENELKQLGDLRETLQKMLESDDLVKAVSKMINERLKFYQKEKTLLDEIEVMKCNMERK